MTAAYWTRHGFLPKDEDKGGTGGTNGKIHY